MPRIIADLGGFEHYAWVATAYLLTSTAAVPIFGKLSDIYGRKWFYVGGLLLFMFASALCGLSQSMTQLIAFRGLQGVAGGILAANAFAIIGDLFPPGGARQVAGGDAASVFGVASVDRPGAGRLVDRWAGLALGLLRQSPGRAYRRRGPRGRSPRHSSSPTGSDRLAGSSHDRRGHRPPAARLLLGRRPSTPGPPLRSSGCCCWPS